MVGHRFVELAVERGLLDSHRVVVVGEEGRRAYDRVHLSSVFDGVDADDLALGAADLYATDGVELVLGDRVDSLDTAGRRATTASGRTVDYEVCVLATGSYPFVPPIPGVGAPGT